MLDAGELSIRRAAANGEVWLGIGGEVDLQTADQFRRAVQAAVAEAEVGVALDLSGVTFFGSHGIGGLVNARRTADSQGIRFLIRRAPPMMVRVLEVAGLHDLLIGTEVCL